MVDEILLTEDGHQLIQETAHHLLLEAVPEVSEPPWINLAKGTALPNGTTSHTINFGFTAGTGTVLVFIIIGAVTHTVSAGGWTKRQGPVNSAELALFEVAGAGQTSITVTHNGADYSARWLCYEFRAGTTYTNSSSETANDNTPPALGSLPGTKQVIIGAFGMDVSSLTGSTSTTSWISPWVEDEDTFVNKSGTAFTDGSYLTVAHQINYTGSSITPPTIALTDSGSPTYAVDRQKVMAAYNVPAS